MKTSAAILAAVALLLMSSTASAATAEECAQARQDLSNYESQLQKAEQYYNMTHTGGSPMSDPNIRQMSDIIRQMKQKYNEECGPGSVRDESYGSSSSNAAEGGYSGGQDGGGYSGAGPGRDIDNPFESPGDNAYGSGPDNPFDGPRRHISDNGPDSPVGRPSIAGSGTGPGGGTGGSGGNTEPSSKGSSKSALRPGDKDDKPLTFDYPTCKYFTKPLFEPEKNRLHAYSKGSWVCYGSWMYECTEDRGWVARGKCSDYDRFTVRHAEDIEKSRIKDPFDP